jgi:hypothetical protein
VLSSQKFGHQTDRISIPNVSAVVASKLWSGRRELPKCIFAENEHVRAPIGYPEEHFPLRHPFQSPYFVDLLTNFRFADRG